VESVYKAVRERNVGDNKLSWWSFGINGKIGLKGEDKWKVIKSLIGLIEISY